MELLESFEEFDYPNEIGPGVYDIHSPNVPSVEWIEALLKKAEQRIPAERLWVNPDCGLKTRGWGNVSVENNHIDVFIFEFADVLRWLSKEYNEPRFSDFAEVISTSMCQLLPYKGHMCGVIKVGYYPEVIQHTNWDYGRNGKGYYNDMFAPGWTVASLWELLTPGRTENILLK